MPSPYALLLANILFLPAAFGQTSDLVVFSEAGERFTLVVDGEERNSAPAARVVATGIRNSTPQVVVRFAEAGITPLKQNAWMEPGQEYTIKITTNKKGERVFRMQGTAPLGTAASATPSERARPVDFHDDPTGDPPMEHGVTHSTTTTTTVVEGAEQGEDVRIDMAVPGMRVQMNVPDAGTTGNTRTTTTRTTTTTTTGSSFMQGGPGVERGPSRSTPEAYRMPGYSGPIGCAQAPLSASEFESIKASVADKKFEDTKLSSAKTIAGSRCFTAEQVKQLMEVLSFEDSRLDLAKFAYDRTHDVGNYYKVNDAFKFESSIEELDKYVRSR